MRPAIASLKPNCMKMLRLIFAGVLLAFVCVGFSSCTHNSEDIDPILIENVVDQKPDDSKSENDPGGEKEDNEKKPPPIPPTRN